MIKNGRQVFNGYKFHWSKLSKSSDIKNTNTCESKLHQKNLDPIQMDIIKINPVLFKFTIIVETLTHLQHLSQILSIFWWA